MPPWERRVTWTIPVHDGTRRGSCDAFHTGTSYPLRDGHSACRFWFLCVAADAASSLAEPPFDLRITLPRVGGSAWMHICHLRVDPRRRSACPHGDPMLLIGRSPVFALSRSGTPSMICRSRRGSTRPISIVEQTELSLPAPP